MTGPGEVPTLDPMPVARYEQQLVERIADFNDPRRSGGDSSPSCWGPSSWSWWQPAAG